MSIHEGPGAFKIEAREAPSFHMMGTLWRVLASKDTTGGVVGALDERCAHGLCAPMHTHDDADEIFYVLDGDLTFFVGEQRIEAAPGAFIYLPRYVHHGFTCNSTEARVFNFLTPAGFEQLILDGGKPARYDEAPIPNGPRDKPPLTPDMFSKYRMRSVPGGSP
jgi:mannose-6-phosphate isomerase-like protein (cupin superfamily)